MKADRPVECLSRAAPLDRVAQTLAAAFQDDPAFVWIVPDAAMRRRMLPRFFRVMAEQSQRHGEVLATPDQRAVALWFPPGEVRDGPLRLLGDTLRLAAQFGRALPRGIRIGDDIHAHHPKPQPHAYLRFVGVAPEGQGKGWGGAIIRAGIARAATAGRGVLLETATPGNVAIYARLGFEVVEEWRAGGGGPRFWTMIRPCG